MGKINTGNHALLNFVKMACSPMAAKIKIGGVMNKKWRKLSYWVGWRITTAMIGRKNHSAISTGFSQPVFTFRVPLTATNKPIRNIAIAVSVNCSDKSTGR